MQQAKQWAGALLVIVLLAVGMGYLASPATTAKPQNTGQPPIAPVASPSPPLSDSRQFLPRLRQLARQTKGDWTRVLPQDQQLLDGYTGGHGRAMFRMMAKEHASLPASTSGNKK